MGLTDDLMGFNGITYEEMGLHGIYYDYYPLPSGKFHTDLENHQFWVKTNLPTPMTARIYVDLLEGNQWFNGID